MSKAQDRRREKYLRLKENGICVNHPDKKICKGSSVFCEDCLLKSRSRKRSTNKRELNLKKRLEYWKGIDWEKIPKQIAYEEKKSLSCVYKWRKIINHVADESNYLMKLHEIFH